MFAVPAILGWLRRRRVWAHALWLCVDVRKTFGQRVTKKAPEIRGFLLVVWWRRRHYKNPYRNLINKLLIKFFMLVTHKITHKVQAPDPNRFWVAC